MVKTIPISSVETYRKINKFIDIIIDDETNYYYKGVDAIKQELLKQLKLL